MNTFIYGLVDPRTNQLRYVGKSDAPRRRLVQHYEEYHNPYLVRWLRILSAHYLIPKILILDEVPADDWERYEIDWIASMKATYGKRIINIHGGGMGGDTMGGRKHKPETIIKMKEIANRNKENRARAARIGWQKSPKRKCFGEDGSSAKLTEAQVRQIFDMYQKGNITQDELGKQFGVCRTAVGEIIRGASWTHLELLEEN